MVKLKVTKIQRVFSKLSHSQKNSMGKADKNLVVQLARGDRDLLDGRLRGQLVTIWKPKIFGNGILLP